MNCIECGREALLVKKPIVLYDGIRVQDVYLKNAEVEVCRHCGGETPVIRNIKKVHLMIALGIALQPTKLSGDEVRFLRKAIRLNVAEWATRIGIAAETFSRWENGRSPAQQVEKLARIDFLIAIAKDLSVDIILPDSIVDVLTSDLGEKRDFGIIVDAENLDERPAYANLSSAEFAVPSLSYIEASTVANNTLAPVRLFGGGKMLVADQSYLVCSGEKEDARNSFAFAA